MTCFPDRVIKGWRDKSGCPTTDDTSACSFNLDQAPFRLLAIVNRIDLSGPSDFYNPNVASPGEFRFVFGFVNRLVEDTDSLNGALEAAVILEYNLPPTRTTFDGRAISPQA